MYRNGNINFGPKMFWTNLGLRLKQMSSTSTTTGNTAMVIYFFATVLTVFVLDLNKTVITHL